MMGKNHIVSSHVNVNAFTIGTLEFQSTHVYARNASIKENKINGQVSTSSYAQNDGTKIFL